MFAQPASISVCYTRVVRVFMFVIKVLKSINNFVTIGSLTETWRKGTVASGKKTCVLHYVKVHIKVQGKSCFVLIGLFTAQGGCYQEVIIRSFLRVHFILDRG